MGRETEHDNDDHIQTPGRKENAAQPLDAAKDNAGAQRYPPERKDDAVEEDRSFAPANPEPRQGAGDSSRASTQEGRLGPEGDPAEGKR
jgi:hypothetical protein